VCGVAQPARVLEAIAQGMSQTLQAAKADARIPAALLANMRTAWEEGLGYV
jgi:serine/threonine-protein kinase HipA